MKKAKQWVSILSSLAASALLLAACSSGGGTTATPSGNPGTSGGDLKQKFQGQTLNLLTWEGYADSKFTKGFEDKYGVKVNPVYFGSKGRWR